MGSISLRAYIREIESQIEQGYYDQAITHSKYILKYFPKNIDAYRLLGKAYLESQRYGDAADIFQRVLSSIPEDFVSNVGMSIIREDEGNLDEAIWHMERAFESQPANNAIQTELKRLYGRRDGVEPLKINLTRGALARMYIKGGLYQQAIAELRISLAEDPQRLDLQALLATAYYQNGQKVEAAETCNLLLSKLPYCMDANRILADILAESNRSDEAQAYRSRLHSLNPYLSHISDNVNTADQVPENAIMLDRMDDQATKDYQRESEQPAWASSLGVKMEDQDDEIPVWLSDDEGISATNDIPEVIPETSAGNQIDSHSDIMGMVTDETQNESDDSIPEWMKEAGWQQSLPEADQVVEPFNFSDENSHSDELADADIPDWLKTLAPENESSPDSTSSALDEYQEVSIPWLDEIPPGPTDSIALWLEENETTQDSSPVTNDQDLLENTPEWIQEMTSKSGINIEVHDLDEATIINKATNDQEADIIKPLHEDDLPAWLKEMEESTGELEVLPTWMEKDTSVDSLIQPENDIFPTFPEDNESLPAWLKEDKHEVEKSVIENVYDENQVDINEQQMDTPVDEELPDWLIENEYEMQETKEQTFSPNTENIFPAWLLEDSSETNKDDDFFQEEISKPGELFAADMPQIEADTDENLASLEEIFSTNMVNEDIVSDDISVQQEELRDSLGDTKPVKVDKIENIPPKELDELSESDSDAAFAWLESLAAKQGADEALLLKPEDRLEKPPDWVIQTTEESDEFSQTPIQLDSESDQPITEDEELPDWLTQPVTDTLQPEAGYEETTDIITPEWLIFQDETSYDFIDEEVTETIEITKEADNIFSQPEVDTHDIKELVNDTIEEPSLETPITDLSEEIFDQELAPDTGLEIIAEQELRETAIVTSDLLNSARNEFASGSIQNALKIYTQLIESRELLPEVISDINENLYNYPLEINLWVSLGDAHMQSNELQQALDAYKKAEELLR